MTYDKTIFTLEPTREVRSLVGREITVCEYPNGQITFEHQGVILPLKSIFDKLRRVMPQVVSRKLLGPALEEIRSEVMTKRAPFSSTDATPMEPPSPISATNERLSAAFAMAAGLQKSLSYHSKRNYASPDVTP